MSYASNSTGSAAGNTNTTSTAALSVTAGRTLVIVFSTQEGSGVASFTCADTAGNTYGSVVVDVGTFGERVIIFVVHNCLGHASNVATVTSSSNHRFKYITQVQLDTGGTGTTDDFDEQENAGSADGTTPSMDATGAGTIVYGTSSTNDRSWTPNTNFTEIQDAAAGHSVGYRDIASGGSYTAGAQASGASNICVGAVIVKNAAGGGGGRTTKNTRAFPLGVEAGMGFGMGG